MHECDTFATLISETGILMLIGKLCRPCPPHRRCRQLETAYRFSSFPHKASSSSMPRCGMMPSVVAGIQVGFRADDGDARRFNAYRVATFRCSTARDALFCSRRGRINHFTYTARWRAKQCGEDTQQNRLCFQCSLPPFSTRTAGNDAHRQNLSHPACPLCVTSYCCQCRRS